MRRFVISGETDFPKCEKSPKMVVLDVSDLSNPRVVIEEERDRTVVSFASIEGILFCSAKRALEIFDISALPTMKSISVLEGLRGGSTAIVDESGEYLFLSSWDKRFDIVDVSDLKHPFFVSACGCDYFSDEDEWSNRNNIKPYGISQMEKQGDFLIAIAMEYNINKRREALLVYDIGRLNEPKMLAKISTAPIRTHAMAINGNYAYAGGYEKILSINLQHPEEPEIVGETELKGICANYFCVEEDHLFVSGSFLEARRRQLFFGVVDISNPVHPKLLGKSILPLRTGYGITVREGVAYIACSEGLAFFDIGNPNNPRVLSTHQTTRDGFEFLGIEVVTVP